VGARELSKRPVVSVIIRKRNGSLVGGRLSVASSPRPERTTEASRTLWLSGRTSVSRANGSPASIPGHAAIGIPSGRAACAIREVRSVSDLVEQVAGQRHGSRTSRRNSPMSRSRAISPTSSSRSISSSASHAGVVPDVEPTDQCRPVGLGALEHVEELTGGRFAQCGDNASTNVDLGGGAHSRQPLARPSAASSGSNAGASGGIYPNRLPTPLRPILRNTALAAVPFRSFSSSSRSPSYRSHQDDVASTTALGSFLQIDHRCSTTWTVPKRP
jgi:hypothetical protein